MNSDAAPAVTDRYHARTPWSAWRALAAAIVLTVLGIALSVSLGVAIGAGGGFDSGDFAHPVRWAPMMVFQVILCGGSLWLAGLFNGGRRLVMALDRPPPSWTHVALYFVLMGILSIAYTLMIFSYYPDIVRADLGSFEPMIHSTIWPVYALIIVVGAPLSEETLFRGFLQPALAQSRLGYWGASVVTTLAWAALHIQYSIFGLIEIVAVGFALSWVLKRTGSLWATIAIHGLYNAAQLVGTALRLFPWT